VQGFLQTLAMFYADEAIYVFESGSALLRIPRLPVVLKADEEVRQHLAVFRRLGKNLASAAVSGVPETLLMQCGGEVALSPWGSLVWERTRKEIYREQLWPAPSAKLVYGAGFETSLHRLPPDRLQQINERVDDLVAYLETHQDQRSLRFHELKGNPTPPSTHEVYAWSDQDARRIYGQFDGDTFVLDRLGKHL
jgi:hypothetical protein